MFRRYSPMDPPYASSPTSITSTRSFSALLDNNIFHVSEVHPTTMDPRCIFTNYLYCLGRLQFDLQDLTKAKYLSLFPSFIMLQYQMSHTYSLVCVKQILHLTQMSIDITLHIGSCIVPRTNLHNSSQSLMRCCLRPKL